MGGALGEELFTDPACVLGGHHGVAHGPLVCEDLMVVPTLWRHEADTAIAWGQGYQREEQPAIGRGRGFLGYLVPLETERQSRRERVSPSPEL